MIAIFAVQHLAGLFGLSLIASARCKEKTKILILPEAYDGNTDLYEKIATWGLFEKIITCPNYSKGPIYSDESKTESEIHDYVINDLEQYLVSNDINPKQISEVYVINDGSNCFHIYAAHLGNKIKKIIFEYGLDDLYNRQEKPRSGFSKGYIQLMKTIGDYNLSLFDHVFFFKDSKIHPKSKVKSYEVIDYLNLINEIPTELRKKMTIFSDANNFSNTNVVICSSDIVLKADTLLPRRYYPILHQLLIDYYCDEGSKIIVKPHPKNNLKAIQAIGDVTIMDNYPIDFILLNNNVSIPKIITIGSISDRLLVKYGVVEKSIKIGYDYFRSYELLYQLDVVVDYMNNIAKSNGCSIKFINNTLDNTINTFLENHTSIGVEGTEQQSASINYDFDIKETAFETDYTIIISNSRNVSCCLDKKIKNNTIAIKIDIDSKNDAMDSHAEYLLVVSDKKMIDNYQYSRNCNYSRTSFDAKTVNLESIPGVKGKPINSFDAKFRRRIVTASHELYRTDRYQYLEITNSIVPLASRGITWALFQLYRLIETCPSFDILRIYYISKSCIKYSEAQKAILQIYINDHTIVDYKVLIDCCIRLLNNDINILATKIDCIINHRIGKYQSIVPDIIKTTEKKDLDKVCKLCYQLYLLSTSRDKQELPDVVGESEESAIMDKGYDGQFDTLYNAGHYGYISYYVLHRMMKKTDKKSIILIDDEWFSTESLKFIRAVEKELPFDKVIFYSEKDLDKKSPDLLTDILSMFDKIMEKEKVDLTELTNVYTGYDTSHAFGIYLYLKKKHYTVFDNTLQSSTPENSPRYNQSYYNKLLKKYEALTWKCPYVDNVLYTRAESAEELYNEISSNNVVFSNRRVAEGKSLFTTAKTMYNQLTTGDQNRIRQIYGLNDIKKFDTLLLLTSSTFMDRPRCIEQSKGLPKDYRFIMPFAMLLDYLQIDGKVIIKAHPNKEVKERIFKDMFSKDLYISGSIPSELIGCCNLEINTAISPGSISVSTVKANNKITISKNYFEYYFDVIDIMIANDLSSLFKCDGITIKGIPEELVDSFHSLFSIKKSKIKARSMTYLNEFLSEMPDDNYPLFITKYDGGGDMDGYHRYEIKVSVKNEKSDRMEPREYLLYLHSINTLDCSNYHYNRKLKKSGVCIDAVYQKTN